MKKEVSIQLTYVSLFSGAWIWCYGFQLEDFTCVSTVEILEKRLKIQRHNNKCMFQNGYICWDIRQESVKDQLRANVKYLQEKKELKDLDVLIATPPCQGMSVANHKKQNEKGRNSLVVESIKLTKEFFPKVFVFENVSSFLNTICTDVDWNDKKISESIMENLSGLYHIVSKIVNFKNYGNNSSRTRTLVIGVRKDQKNITPFDLFPDYQKERTLYEVIGDLPELKEMWEISHVDIYHHFKPYSEHMREWIKDLQQWESAFDNKDIKKIPHKIENGLLVQNKNKNGDKYRRQVFDKVAPCIHTRNDILSSQNTIHPKDDRVFSLRELMRMMTIPDSFRWVEATLSDLNSFSLDDKRKILKKEEMTIRHAIGEAVPTVIFQQIASKIKIKLFENAISTKKLWHIINQYNLTNVSFLKTFVLTNPLQLNYTTLLTLAELSNSKRIENSAYYTTQNIVFSVIKNLPDSKNFKRLTILEPSVGVWAFLPLLIKKYQDVEQVEIDVLDIDADSLDLMKILLQKIKIPNNIKINFINEDFLTYNFEKKYDIIVGNPPFGKKKYIFAERPWKPLNDRTRNVFSFFLERSIQIGTIVALILPKSLLNAPEFDITRNFLKSYKLQTIIDFGEKAFYWVKIETIALILNSKKQGGGGIIVDSYITNQVLVKEQHYITDKKYPSWLIYRDEFFDKISEKLTFNLYRSFRDRQITKRHTQKKWKFRVLKSRNIASNRIIDIENYDSYIDDLSDFSVKKYLNARNVVLIPNLTYALRACFLPRNSITDWSVAILTLKDDGMEITKKDLEYYSTQEFLRFYSIARNLGTRSLNIDNNSIFYFWKLK